MTYDVQLRIVRVRVGSHGAQSYAWGYDEGSTYYRVPVPDLKAVELERRIAAARAQGEEASAWHTVSEYWLEEVTA